MTGEIDFSLTYPGGHLRTLTIGATAGNTTTNESPGTGTRWIILYGSITLSTNGTVANRVIRTMLTDGSDVLTRFLYSPNITASQTKVLNYNNAIEVDGSHTSQNFISSLGNPIIEGADQLRIQVDGGVAGDSYSGFIRVLEFGL
tara:strand:+ start:214 stop:648 length:435 start_codon:yes stop_codon:yes gene_type:complete